VCVSVSVCGAVTSTRIERVKVTNKQEAGIGIGIGNGIGINIHIHININIGNHHHLIARDRQTEQTAKH